MSDCRAHRNAAGDYTCRACALSWDADDEAPLCRPYVRAPNLVPADEGEKFVSGLPDNRI